MVVLARPKEAPIKPGSYWYYFGNGPDTTELYHPQALVRFRLSMDGTLLK
jgi:hypothetical protein